MLEKHLVGALILVAAPAMSQTTTGALVRSEEAQRIYEHGQDLMQREAFEDAAAQFRAAIRLDASHWLAHYGLGQSQMSLKRYPEAVKAYLACRDVFVNFASLDLSQQNTLERAREDEIRQTQDELLQVQQGKVKGGSTHSLEVQLQERLRVLEGARMRGKERVVAVPAELMLGLGSAYFRSGQLGEAESSFVEAAKIDPKLGPAHNNLAVMYMMSGRFDDAKNAVKRAEKSGMRVSDAFKQELDRRASTGATPK